MQESRKTKDKSAWRIYKGNQKYIKYVKYIVPSSNSVQDSDFFNLTRIGQIIVSKRTIFGLYMMIAMGFHVIMLL